MIRREKPNWWRVSGFYHYRPENRISRGMVAAVPWVNIALLVAMYLYFQQPFVLQPGVRIQLPAAPFTAGSGYGHNVVVLTQDSPGGGGRREVVFFDDERFEVAEPAKFAELGARLGQAFRKRPDAPMLIEADKVIQHGTIVTLFNMGAAAGFKEITVATLPAR